MSIPMTPPDAKAELLPCPFCGSTAFVDGSYDICCDSCGATSHVHDTEADAIAAWNSRVYPSDFCGWRSDMENAPRDGTAVLGWMQHGNGLGYVLTVYFQDGGWRTPVRDTGYMPIPAPTCWQFFTPPVEGG